MLHPCDGKTDGRRDGRAIAHSALSIYAIWCRTLKTVGFLALKTYFPTPTLPLYWKLLLLLYFAHHFDHLGGHLGF